jgi:hypothetical protein
MSAQEKLDDAKVSKVINSYNCNERRVFMNVLDLLTKNNKQALLLVELVESMAFQKLKDEIAPKTVTVEHEGILVGCVPLGFAVTGEWTRVKNLIKYQQLKKHFAAIRNLLEDAVVT